MNTPYFQSFLAPHLHQFVQYKRALNRKYLNDAHTLRLFDRYLCNHDIADWHAIDSAVVDDFLASRPKVGPKRYNLILYAVRRFFAFAIMQQWTQRNPVTASPRRITGSRIPYLFDLDTARRLMAEARKLPERSRALSRPCVRDDFRPALWPGIAGRRSVKTEDERCRFHAQSAVHPGDEIRQKPICTDGTSSSTASKRLRSRTIWMHASF
jgi:hypothetical protein